MIAKVFNTQRKPSKRNITNDVIFVIVGCLYISITYAHLLCLANGILVLNCLKIYYNNNSSKFIVFFLK